MCKKDFNSLSGYVMLVLAATALLAVLSGYIAPPQRDEGAAAHIFQLSIAALAPLILSFVATADWGQPRRSARPLILSAVALGLALGALYYLENYRNPGYVQQLHRINSPSGGRYPIAETHDIASA